MATTSIGTAWIQIKPTTKGLRQAVDRELNTELSASAEAQGTSSGKIIGSSLLEGIKKTFTVAVVGATIGKVLKDSVTVSAEFEASMSQVAATLGYSIGELNDKTSEASQTMSNLADFAKELGQTTKFTARESASALNSLALAGLNAEQSMQLLPATLNLAAAGNLGLEEATTLVITAQKALGLSAEQTNVLIDQIAATATKTENSVSTLGEAIQTVGALAKGLSGGTKELTAELGVLGDVGYQGAEGGTKLRNILVRLQAPTASAKKQFEALGVSIYDENGKLRNTIEIFQDLGRAMEGFTQQEQDTALSDIFNVRDLAAASALIQTTTERWNELDAAIMDSTNAAQQMAEVQMGNLQGDVIQLKSAFETLEINIGDFLSPITTAFTQLGTAVIQFINGKDADVGQAIVNLVSNVVDWFVNSLLGEDNLSRIFQGAITLFMQLARAIPDIIVAIIEKIPDLIVNIVDFLTNPENIMAIINGAKDLFMGIVQAVPKILGALFSAFGNLFGGLWEVLKERFGQFAATFGDFIGGIFKSAINAVLGFIENFINSPIRLINKFIGLINNAFGFIGVNIGLIGEIKLPRLAKGGIVTGVGTDTSDSNLYALSKGEYVIKAASARQIGYNNLDRMNRTGETGKTEVVNNITINGYEKDPEELATLISRKIALRTQGVF